MLTNLTQEKLKEYFHYDESTGNLINLTQRSNSIKIGAVAGGLDAYGYVRIRVDGTDYKAHRLVWVYVQGNWPEDQIDHINGIKTDNRICNLREATDQENKQNISKPRKDNTSGFLGVSFRADRQKWRALISHNGRYIHLGHFHTPEEACMAYKKAKCFYHPFYNKENTQ